MRGCVVRLAPPLRTQTESYAEYRDHVNVLRQRFESTETSEHRFQILRELELAADSELQRFLRMKAKATFVF